MARETSRNVTIDISISTLGVHNGDTKLMYIMPNPLDEVAE